MEYKSVAIKLLSNLKTRNSVIFRVVTSFVSLFFLSTYPMYMFFVYMANNGFYAYETQENTFSINLFFIATLLTLVIFGIALSFSFFPIKIHRLKNPEAKLKESIKKNWFVVLSNLVIFVVAISIAKIFNNAPLLAALAIGCFISAILFSLLFLSTFAYFAVFTTCVIIAYAQPILDQAEAASVLEIGLKKFNVGAVDITLKKDKTETKTHLVFLSPNYIYVKDPATNNISIIPRTPDITITFHRKP